MKKIIVFVLVLISFSNAAFAGGPWVMDKGKSYFKLSEWAVVFNQHFTSTGLLDPNTTTGVYSTFLYGEFGITDRFTALLNSTVSSSNSII